MSTDTVRHIIPPMSTRPPMFDIGESAKNASMTRNHFTTSTWLLLGALAQIFLSLLPIRKVYGTLPVVLILLLQGLNYLTIYFGWKRNPYMEGVIPGKVTAMFPASPGTSEQPGDDKICIVLLGARSNHPNGIFSKDFNEIGKFFTSMQKDLEGNAATNGFLGATTWLNTSDRITASELMVVFYFKSSDHVHNWAHGPVHRAGWDWWIQFTKEGRAGPFSLMHEIFEAPKGAWDCVYLNYKPSGFGSTLHPVTDENGQLQWVNPLIDPREKHKLSRAKEGN